MELGQNYPNPFNPVTTIRFRTGSSTYAVIDVYDVNGRFVSRIFEGTAGPEKNTVTWDGTNGRGVPVSSGIYFCRLRAGEQALSRKMILLR